MTDEKRAGRSRVLILLSLSLVIQSLSSVFIKYAGTYETFSREFIIFYVLAVGCLGVFAVMWQILLEMIPLTTAYLRKGILYILILIWSVILFQEHVTWNNIIGSIIIIVGISIHGMDEHSLHAGFSVCIYCVGFTDSAETVGTDRT